MLLKIIDALMIIGVILMFVVVGLYYQTPTGRVYIFMLIFDEILLGITHAVIEKYGES